MEKSKVGVKKIKDTKVSEININAVNRNKSSRKSSKISSQETLNENVIMNPFKTFFSKHGLKLATLLLVLIVIAIFTSINQKINVDENSDIAALNADKYSKEIVNLYNRDQQLNEFYTEMNRVQTLVGTYLISNCTLNDNSFSGLVKNLNKEINNDIWPSLNSEKSKYYNGKYSIDENGNLKFKFSSKKIEPTWIHDESIARYVIFN